MVIQDGLMSSRMEADAGGGPQSRGPEMPRRKAQQKPRFDHLCPGPIAGGRRCCRLPCVCPRSPANRRLYSERLVSATWGG